MQEANSLTGLVTKIIKYGLSYVFLLASIFLMFIGSFTPFKIFVILFLLMSGIFFLLHTVVEFNDDFVLLNNKKFGWSDLKKIRPFEIEHVFSYWILQVESNGVKKIYLVRIGQIGIIHVIFSLFLPNNRVNTIEKFLKNTKGIK